MSDKKLVIKHGTPPFSAALIHGGPGAAGEMNAVAKQLSTSLGVLELIQSADSVDGQIEEVACQLKYHATFPVSLVGFSWGAWLAALFAGRHPEMVSKLILISSAAFDPGFNRDLMPARLTRLDAEKRKTAENLIDKMRKETLSREEFALFGKLMETADSYDFLDSEEIIDFNPQVFQSVWTEAFELRRTGRLLQEAGKLKCPVVAIHGVYDPHPVKGVEIPLRAQLKNFRLITLDKCGHKPWKEKQAREKFYSLLKEELEKV